MGLLTKSQFHGYQRQMVNFQVNNLRSMLWGFMGSGKCHGVDTPILMFDGTIKMVQDVKVGDALMGPDSLPRNVLSLANGREELYKVTPTKGDSYTVNKSHILSLKMTNFNYSHIPTADGRKVYPGEIVNISVTDYLDSVNYFHACAKGYRVGVEFPRKETIIPSYILGIWLGDGTCKNASITTGDIEVKGAWVKYGHSKDCHVRIEKGKNCEQIYLSHDDHKFNPVLNDFRSYGLIGNKHIPHVYKTSSRDDRLNLLAGLLDTDGYYNRGYYEIITKFDSLKTDILFLARSLGFAAYSSIKIGKIKSINFEGTYHRICISGHTDEIPCRVARKKASPRLQIKDVLVSQIKVEPIGPGEYYGFEITGDRLYLLGDFTVTHNTIVTLTTAQHLIQHGHSKGVLVLGPKRVVQSVWEKESRKWDHTQHMTFSKIMGNPDRRMSAIFQQADVHLTNYDNLAWLSAQLQAYFLDRGLPLPFDMLVCDEISMLKNSDTARMEALLPLLPSFTRRTGLTGTPACNGYIDLHGQYLAIDDGVRLGDSKDAYINAYFKQTGWGGYSHEIAENNNEIIERNISDITLQMNEEDYIKLPPFMVFDLHAQMPPKARKEYVKMEALMFAEMDDGESVEVTSEVSKINKLLQMSNGAAYTNTETREWSKLHDAKLDVLADIVEEAGGNPVLVGYNFRTDAARILKRFKFAVDLTPMNDKEFNQAIQDFSAGRIRMLLGHPKSMGHGTDGLQYGGNILVWFGLPWSLEMYKQLNKRLSRQGQGKPVTCYRILCPDTMDEAVSVKLTMKDDTEKSLRAAVGAYRKTKS